jgi:hypothetical protein
MGKRFGKNAHANGVTIRASRKGLVSFLRNVRRGFDFLLTGCEKQPQPDPGNQNPI